MPETCGQTVARPIAGVSRPFYEACKRVLDLLVSGVLLVLLFPVWLAIAGAIKIDSRGPVFFRASVIGRNGRCFEMLKFRSMCVGASRDDHRSALVHNFESCAPTAYNRKGKPIFKTVLVDASRITRVGRFLRRSSLDELPQLWCVFAGDMSLVGPRPSLPWEVELYDGEQRKRLLVKPGMTGLYQVTARNLVPIEEMIRIDLEYVRRRGLLFDFMLLAKTPVAMFSGV